MVRGAPKQGYWKSGLFIAFLTILYGSTGESEYLRASEEHFERAIHNATDVMRTGFSHKLAWASTLLYLTTNDSRYLKASVQIAEHLLSLQQSDGSFIYPEVEGIAGASYLLKMAVLFQFTTWLHCVRSVL
jgi:rhamnogalacturonyl hydrolase YesR